MKITTALLPALLASGLLSITCIAQPIPPPPGAAPPPAANRVQPPAPVIARSTVTKRGKIEAFNIARNGETNGFILRDGTAVMLPPQSGAQLRAIAKEGSRVAVIGMVGPGAPGQVAVDAQTITVKGQTITVPAPAPPPVDPNASSLPGPRGHSARRGPPLPLQVRAVPPAPNGPPPPQGRSTPPPPNRPPPPQDHSTPPAPNGPPPPPPNGI